MNCTLSPRLSLFSQIRPPVPFRHISSSVYSYRRSCMARWRLAPIIIWSLTFTFIFPSFSGQEEKVVHQCKKDPEAGEERKRVSLNCLIVLTSLKPPRVIAWYLSLFIKPSWGMYVPFCGDAGDTQTDSNISDSETRHSTTKLHRRKGKRSRTKMRTYSYVFFITWQARTNRQSLLLQPKKTREQMKCTQYTHIYVRGKALADHEEVNERKEGRRSSNITTVKTANTTPGSSAYPIYSPFLHFPSCTYTPHPNSDAHAYFLSLEIRRTGGSLKRFSYFLTLARCPRLESEENVRQEYTK